MAADDWRKGYLLCVGILILWGVYSGWVFLTWSRSSYSERARAIAWVIAAPFLFWFLSRIDV